MVTLVVFHLGSAAGKTGGKKTEKVEKRRRRASPKKSFSSPLAGKVEFMGKKRTYMWW